MPAVSATGRPYASWVPVTVTALDRRIGALAVPALGTLAVEPLYVLVDTAIVGRLGTVPLGGVALASTVLVSAVWVFNFLAYGTTSRVAFLVGRGDPRAGAAVAVQGLWLSIAIGVPLAAAVALLARPLASLLGGDGAVLDAAVTYLRISAVGIPAVLVALVGNGYLRGLADTRTPLVVVVVANAVNVVLELAMVYGFDLGVAGSAWSTVAAQGLAAGWFFLLLRRGIVATGAGAAADRVELGLLLSAGRRLFVRTAALLATVALATSVAARLGTVALAGHHIALQIHLFLAMLLDALAVPGQILVATALGAGDGVGARVVGERLVRVGVAVGVVLGAGTLAVSGALPHLFTADAAVADRATAALVVVAVAQVPSAIAFVLDGVLAGAADFGFLQWSLLGGLALFAPVGLAVAAWPRLGLVGLWGGLLAWMAYRATANLVRARALGTRHGNGALGGAFPRQPQ